MTAMMKLKDVYNIPCGFIALTDYLIESRWFPDVSELEYGIHQHAVLVKMEAAGRLQVKQVAYLDCRDGDRMAALYTLWFDGAPVAIFQIAGRGGRDHFQRWITHPAAYLETCNYLRSVLTDGQGMADQFDPEKDIYPEEVFRFYNQDFGTALGYPSEGITEGFLLYFETLRVLPGPKPEYILVEAESKFDPAPEFIRRSEYIFQKVAEVSDEELAKNIRCVEAKAETGNRYYWYTPATRPENTPVLSV